MEYSLPNKRKRKNFLHIFNIILPIIWGKIKMVNLGSYSPLSPSPSYTYDNVCALKETHTRMPYSYPCHQWWVSNIFFWEGVLIYSSKALIIYYFYKYITVKKLKSTTAPITANWWYTGGHMRAES